MTLLKTSLLVVFLFFAHAASAVWVKIDDCELIKESDVIIQGEFLGTTELISPENTVIINPGVIHAHKTFKGQTLDIVLIEQPKLSGPINSADIVFQKGQIGIWFLKLKNNALFSIYSATTPQHFWTQDKAHDLKELMTKCLKSE